MANTLQEPTSTRADTSAQQIQLVPTTQLPDSQRSLFPFSHFNPVQSECFGTAYRSDDNLVLCAPTGSGKTAVFELAICRAAFSRQRKTEDLLMVYQAPTKSLCSERYQDWSRKFGQRFNVAEFTGDTDPKAQRTTMRKANLIITTPEKWDFATRKSKENKDHLRPVCLFMVDEIHFLKEDRGSSLEAVVARMKMSAREVRFMAVSATLPNAADVAKWLGRNSHNQRMPAVLKVFGEEFRPVPLEKIVVGIPAVNQTEFWVDGACNERLPDLIINHANDKPTMIFCSTRISTATTAKMLADSYWDRFGWKAAGSDHRIQAILDEDLRYCMEAGVAFHNAGLSHPTRKQIQDMFLEGSISIICCTSTLAVGVNLPCHLVIIKNTVCYQESTFQEYAEHDVLQMLGRAGRPQFDSSAVAIIMTRQEKAERYKRMVSGSDVLESGLLRNLIEHLNAEISIGTIKNPDTAREWISSTFFFTRLLQNPHHYNIDRDLQGRNTGETIRNLCNKILNMLGTHRLVAGDGELQCTDAGHAMARYCVIFATMKLITALPPKAKTSELLSVIAQASEFKNIRFRSLEQPYYNALNKDRRIKFPIPVNPTIVQHKISLIIQDTLAGTQSTFDQSRSKGVSKSAHEADRSIIFSNVHRIIRCIIDCYLHAGDAVTARNGLALSRSLAAHAWDDTPAHMIQAAGIGPASLLKLSSAGISSLDELECTDAQRIEMLLSRNPPFGTQLRQNVEGFPRLWVTLRTLGLVEEESSQPRGSVRIQTRAEVGFLNTTTPHSFAKKETVVCLLAEVSDGRVAHFCKLSAGAVAKPGVVNFVVELTEPNQSITCYVACDDIAGTLKEATTVPVVPARAFEQPQVDKDRQAGPTLHVFHSHDQTRSPGPKSQKSAPRTQPRKSSAVEPDEFGNEGITDADLETVANDGFADIDDLVTDTPIARPKEKWHAYMADSGPGTSSRKRKTSDEKMDAKSTEVQWTCSHFCRDKGLCGHNCCKFGVKNPKKCTAWKNRESKKLAPDTTCEQRDARKTNEDQPEMSMGVRTNTTMSLEFWDIDRIDTVPVNPYRIDPSLIDPLLSDPVLFDATQSGPGDLGGFEMNGNTSTQPGVSAGAQIGAGVSGSRRENEDGGATPPSAYMWVEAEFGSLVDFE